MDVLDSTPTPARRRPAAPVAPAWVLVALVALVVPDVRDDGLDLLDAASSPHPPGTISLVLDPGPAVVGRTAGRPWDGVLVLHAEGGPAVLQVSAAAQAAAVGPTVSHAWGGLRASVDDRQCTGTFGWRAASGDPYGGGRVDLVCDDGSSLTGELRSYDRPPVEDAAWSGILDLAPG